MIEAGADYWATALLVAPLLAALVTLVIPGRYSGFLAVVALAAHAACAVALTVHVLEQGPVAVSIGGWTAPLGIAWQIDGLAAAMLLCTGVIAGAIALFAFLPSGHPVAGAFWTPFLFEVAALTALFMSADLFNIYVCLELSALAAVSLVAQGRGSQAVVASIRYLMITLAGGVSYFFGAGLIYAQYGSLELSIFAAAAGANDTYSLLAVSLVTCGLAAKAALFPLHAWLPPAHGSAPAPASAMLSGLVVEAALYVLIRLWFAAAETGAIAPAVLAIFNVLALGSMIWGGLLALQQQRVKAMLAFSTVTQVGYIAMAIPLASAGAAALSEAWLGAGMLLAAHAFAKAGMFLAAGIISASANSDDLGNIRGAAHSLPMTTFALGLGALTLIGLPPSGGFAAKWLLLSAGLSGGQWWLSMAIAASGLLTAVYLFRALRLAFSGGRTYELEGSRSQQAVVLCLALISLVLGIAPAPVLELLGQTAFADVAP